MARRRPRCFRGRSSPQANSRRLPAGSGEPKCGAGCCSGMAQNGSKRVVYAALYANLLIAITKFAAAAFTGSSAMLSEAFHSVADSANEALLLFGAHRAARPPDVEHPFGCGRGLDFWGLRVAVVMFGIGAGLSFYEGVHRILAPRANQNVYANYVVLVAALIFETWSWMVAIREFRRQKGRLGDFQAARRSKDPQGFIILFEDSAALVGLVLALVATALSDWLGQPWIDGAGSIAIGLVLAAVAGLLETETRNLLIGDTADPQMLNDNPQ